jgi:hypothetical protein
MVEGISPTRINAARVIAVLADCLQIMVFPVFMEGYLSPFEDILDVAVAIAMFFLLGWHWAFVPSFAAKLVPALDLVPTWTAAVFIVTGFGPAQGPVPVTSGTPAIPANTTPPAPKELPAGKDGSGPAH